MTEKDFGLWVEELCQWLRIRYYHTWNSIHSPRGFPDYVFVGPTRVIYAELKSEKGRQTAKQREWEQALVDAGQEVYLWRPSDMDAIRSVLTTLARGTL